MRNFILSLIAPALFVTGCSYNEEVLDRDLHDRITFESSVYKTKASSVNKENMQDAAYPGFKVLALQNFNTPMAETTDPSALQIFMDQLKVKCFDGKWKNEGTYYWPINPEYKISFFANAPFTTGNNNIVSNIQRDNKSVFFDINIPSSPNEQKDLLAAAIYDINKKNDPNDNNVNLNFRHILSRIKFSAYIPEEKTTNFRISEVKVSFGKMVAEIDLEPISSKGRFVYDLDNELNVGSIIVDEEAEALNGTFELAPASESQAIIIQPGDFAIPLHNDDQALMIMPQKLNGKYIFNIYLTYQTADAGHEWGEKKNFTFFFKGKDYIAGKSYLYNIDISQLLDIVDVGFGTPSIDAWPSDIN